MALERLLPQIPYGVSSTSAQTLRRARARDELSLCFHDEGDEELSL